MEAEIRTPQDREVAAAADVLVGAFLPDAMFRRMIGRRPPEPTLTSLFRLEIERHRKVGKVDIALDPGTGEIVGTAIWSGPEDTDQPWWRGSSDLPAYARALGTRLPIAMRLEITARQMRPRFPHWYLYLLGVSADHQGHGIGGQMLHHGAVRAGDLGCYLEASTRDSARLYARHGYLYQGVVPTGFPDIPTYGMWRPGSLTIPG